MRVALLLAVAFFLGCAHGAPPWSESQNTCNWPKVDLLPAADALTDLKEATTVRDFPRMLAAALRCARAVPTYAGCLRAAAIVLVRDERNAEAVSFYERYLEAAPEACDARETRDLLLKLKSPN